MPCKSCKNGQTDAVKMAKMNQMYMNQSVPNQPKPKKLPKGMLPYDYSDALYRQGAGIPARSSHGNPNAAFNAKMSSIYRR
jgi:hypothetical protein